jgi:pilus assembly protein CpaD
MKRKLRIAVLAGGLALAGCYPPLTAEWTEAEAPKQLGIDKAASQLNLRFAGGSDRLLPSDAARLRNLAAGGAIAPADRVKVAVGGAPRLAAARFAAISRELLRYNIVAGAWHIAGVPANQAIIDTGRYVVSLPACPNWSRRPQLDFSNAHASNFGCATAVNLGRMVASPGDLAEGRPSGPVDAIPAAAAVQRYQGDKVVLPAAAGISTITAPSSGPAGAGATGAGTAGSQP